MKREGKTKGWKSRTKGWKKEKGKRRTKKYGETIEQYIRQKGLRKYVKRGPKVPSRKGRKVNAKWVEKDGGENRQVCTKQSTPWQHHLPKLIMHSRTNYITKWVEKYRGNNLNGMYPVNIFVWQHRCQ